MTVSSTKHIDIVQSTVTDIDQIAAAPCEGFLVQENKNNVGDQPGVATVTVGEWMNRRKSVMEPHADFIRRKSAMLDPDRAICTQIS